MPSDLSAAAWPCARALARLAALRRACALGGVSLALLAPAAHAQTARPAGGSSPEAAARQARRAARLAAPVRRLDPSTRSGQAAGAPALAGRPGRIAFAAAVQSPFGLASLGNAGIALKTSLADFDGDGDIDVLAGVSDGTFRYYRNTAGPTATPVYAAPVTNPFGLTDVGDQPAPAVGDVDGDGDLDVLVGNKGGNSVYFQNTAGPGAAPTYAAAVTNPFGLADLGPGTERLFPSLVDFDGDGDLDLLAGQIDGTCQYFQNTAGPQATPAFAAAVLNPFGLGDVGDYSVVSAHDLDGDGDLDLLVGEGQGNFLYYENTAGPRAVPAFAAPLTNPFGFSDIGAVASPSIADIDGDGDLDVLAGENNTGTFFLFRNTTAGPAAFAAPVILPGLNPVVAGGGGRTAPATADFDGDGDADLLIGDSQGGFTYRLNTAGPTATPVYAAATTPAGLAVVGYDSSPAVGDLDGDGDLDVLAGEYSGAFFYFQNTAGPNAAPAFVAAPPPGGLQDVGNYSKPALADFDGDGDLDVLAGTYGGDFVYFRNVAAPNAPASFVSGLVNPFGLANVGRKATPAVGDLDGDGDLDVLSGEFNGTFVYFRNTAGPSATPAFVAAPMPGGLTDVVNYSTPALADLDGDGDADVLAGSNNNYVEYFRNTSDPGTLTATLAGTEGYRQLAAPTGTPFGDVLGANVFTQGIVGADVTGGQPNVIRYDETRLGVFTDGYVAPGSLDTPLGIGRGAFVYVFADEDPRPSVPGQQGGFPKTLQAAGRPDLVEFDWGGTTPDAPLTFTDSPNPATDDGWNLLGNPFGSWFDWDAVDLANVNAPVYVYDNASANYLAHTRGIPNAGSLPGGIVGPFQGFWAQANAAAPAITARPAVSNGGPLSRGGAPTVVGLRVRPGAGAVLPAGVQSEAYLALGVPDAHDQVSALDAYALTPPAQTYVLLATQAATADGTPAALTIDARPAQTAAVTVDLDLTQVVGGAAAGGALVLDWPALDLPAGWSAWLLDRRTGDRVDLSQATEYPFTLDGPAAVAITPEALAVPALSTAPRVAAAGLTAGRFALVVTPAGATAADGGAPLTLALSAARPNPTTGAASLVLSLPAAADVRVAVYDVLGRQVALLAEGQQAAGETTVRVAAGALAAGTYVVRATVGAQVLTQRLTVTR